jgi:hypothetical protein
MIQKINIRYLSRRKKTSSGIHNSFSITLAGGLPMKNREMI